MVGREIYDTHCKWISEEPLYKSYFEELSLYFYTEYLKITYNSVKVKVNAQSVVDDKMKQLKRRQIKSITSVLPNIDKEFAKKNGQTKIINLTNRYRRLVCHCGNDNGRVRDHIGCTFPDPEPKHAETIVALKKHTNHFLYYYQRDTLSALGYGF